MRSVIQVAFVVLAVIAGGADAQVTLPEGFINELVYEPHLPLPTAIAFAPGGRMFVAFKEGQVILHRREKEPRLFIDLSDEVNTWGDRGLLGIAVHPDFPEQPYVYVLYTHDPPGLPGLAAPDDLPDGQGARVSRLERIECDSSADWDQPTPDGRVVLVGQNSTLDNIGDPTSWHGKASCDEGGSPTILGVPVRDCIPSDGPSHSIGTVAFGTDGMLWMGIGDGARWTDVDPRALRALDVDSLSGKILRIDPISGAAAPDNPFHDGDSFSNRSRVWSLGLRNPFRFAFHPTSGEPYIGDVGWELWEEVNSGRGANFGWPCFEGDHRGNAPQPAFHADPLTGPVCRDLISDQITAPLFSYSRENRGTAVIVGDFYTGNTFPDPYRGALFYADYDRAIIRVLLLDEAGQIVSSEDFASATGGIVHLQQGPDTNLYYVLLGEQNEVRRIRYVGDGNHPPVAILHAEPTEGPVPLTVAFSASESSDPDADPLEFQWDFGDGTTSGQSDPIHTYHTAGVRTVNLTVRDPAGEEGRASVRVFAGNTAPVPEIIAPPAGQTYAIGDTLELSGRAFDERDGELDGDALRWSGLLHHLDHVHPDFFRAFGPLAHLEIDDHGDDTWIELRLEATDSEGLSAYASRELRPREVRLSFGTEPEGLDLLYESALRISPFAVSPPVGSTRQVIAPEVQHHRSFARWADAAERIRAIQVGEEQASYTAIYENLP
ncbi:MAG: PQQ-dependent sugar dehydrogenase, partial [Acidobacteria bacterium]|nr:PQQ-dependent sugar dehydrogenase [Acidobacteriota bacterium]